MNTSNCNWLRHKKTDPIIKELFRAARKSDFVAAMALLDRLGELGHDDFAERLRRTVSVQVGWSDGYKARFISWRVKDLMSEVPLWTLCSSCGAAECWPEIKGPPPGWMLERRGEREHLRCPRCHTGFGRAFSG